MRKITLKSLLTSVFSIVIASSNAQFSFTNSNSLLSTPSYSGCAISVVDLDGDGLDDIIKMNQSTDLVIDMQNKNGSFTHHNLGNISGNSKVWGMAVADVDHNGIKDVVTGPNGTVYLVKLFMNAGVITKTTSTLAGSYFVQNITFGDINNDGWVDLAVCDDNDYMKIYQNNAGSLNLTTSLINTEINPGMTVGGDPYDSGNYGSVWLDFDNDGDLDLYIAHCRQSANTNTDQRRRDRLFVNNGNNQYTESAALYGIEITDFKQTWTTSFGDIDNDGDFDVVMTNHGENSQILENDGDGYFNDITISTGFETNVDPIESITEDFDNDGYVDILISGGGNSANPWIVYHNNGDKTFTKLNNVFPSMNKAMLSFATGDLNHDGAIDVFATYGNVYNSPTSFQDVLFLNNKNVQNHFITFDLVGTVSNLGAIGARATIYYNGGKQIREVRSGESYGTTNSFQLHFGLGDKTSIDSATISWPSGVKTHIGSLVSDEFVKVVENGCIVSGNVIPGPFVICTGQSVTLNAANGFASYSWSNSSTSQSIITSTPGMYNVEVTDANGCKSISPSVSVQLNPDQTPTLSLNGQETFCQGSATSIVSTPAISYSWVGPNGFTATTQSISPQETGAYSVTIQGNCSTFTSTPISVNVLASAAPVASSLVSNIPNTFVLNATGTNGNLEWYDQQVGGNLLGTGNSFTTPLINTTTTFYVQDKAIYPGSVNYTGQPTHTGQSLYSGATVNGGLDFDVSVPCTLKTVKVITATAGIREIQLLNSSGTVINSMSINIPLDTTIVNLNFPLTPALGYRLTTNSTINSANVGSINPMLQRSSSGVQYPYSINNVISITNGHTGTTGSSTAYYYFYDWKVEEPSTVCNSVRTPVEVNIDLTGIKELKSTNFIAINPNPSNGIINLSSTKSLIGNIDVEISDLTGKVIEQISYNGIVANKVEELNLSSLSKGIYFIKVNSYTEQFIKRLVIE